ncbi:MAG: stage III sporulation protein AB [Oscillospiraceae bacterium]|jgi:stage III sporulation protein AB
MFRILGIIMIAGGAAMAGLAAVNTLTLRARLLRQLLNALRYMKSEISFTLAPLPNLISRLSENTQAPIRDFFVECENRLEDIGRMPFSDIWNAALTVTLGRLLREEEMETMRTLGSTLGRYGCEQQSESLETCIRRAARFLESAEEEKERLGHLYGAMGLLSGAAAVVILI